MNHRLVLDGLTVHHHSDLEKLEEVQREVESPFGVDTEIVEGEPR